MIRLSSTVKAVALSTAALAITTELNAERIMHFPMEVTQGNELTETVSGNKISVYGVHGAENMPGAAGKAWRLDGYSSYATGDVSIKGGAVKNALTVSLWVAPETYPIVRHDEATSEKIILAGTLEEGAKKGWAFCLGSTGQYSFVCFTGGWKTEVVSPELLTPYEWSRLMAVADGQRVVLYLNGEQVAETRSLGTIDDSSQTLFIGKGAENISMNGFHLNAFNGLIDDLEVYDEALVGDAISSLPDSPADLSIPEKRFEGDLLRPKLHGMPGANWTNESHGMTYYDGKYHLFFQKNANGPYMSRLHWGHITSPDLMNWTEERIALFPGEAYDVKGCWSGCVFTDDVITQGKPNIIYTGVDYVKAYIAQARPADEQLIEWEKATNNPIINGRPSGLSDDFRDPYFFRNGNDAYVIVGTSKDGVGAVTLHKYIPLIGSWTNNGDIFFAGSDKASCGTFWEMPNITRMPNGKWLFTATPQNTSVGVRTLYWTGEINADGTFRPDASSAAPRGVELISKDGFGLLSPTVYQKDGKTIALGIVPDKLPSSVNYQLGWAHCYSLPREWSLDNEGNLLQKPYEGLRGARSAGGYSRNSFTLNGVETMDEVSGRQVEISGRFTVGKAPFGFHFLKNGASQGTLKYIPSVNMLTIDLTALNRTANDNGSYNGIYSCVLPETLPAGSELYVDMFIDGSVLDIFVNDKWATSIRVFPLGDDANGLEAFSDGDTEVRELKAWTLNFEGGDTGSVDFPSVSPGSGPVDVIDTHGRVLKYGVDPREATSGLAPGIYIVGGRKMIVK